MYFIPKIIFKKAYKTCSQLHRPFKVKMMSQIMASDLYFVCPHTTVIKGQALDWEFYDQD